jgi:hypothetical protein
MSQLRIHARPSLAARLAVLEAAVGFVIVLLRLGYSPLIAVATAVTAVAGGVEIACRLTAPHLAPPVRVTVLVVILVFVVSLLRLGYPPAVGVSVALVTAWCGTEIARRFTGSPYRVPRLVY